MLKFRVDAETVTFDELLALMDKKLSVCRAVMIRSLLDETGAPVPEAEAMQRVGKLSLTQLGPAINALADALRDALLPPASGNES